MDNLSEIFGSLAQAITEDAIASGGKYSLHWEELNETRRKESLYEEKDVQILEMEISKVKFEKEIEVEIGLYDAGLCIDCLAFPKEAKQINKILLEHLDESLEWDALHPNGRMVW